MDVVWWKNNLQAQMKYSNHIFTTNFFNVLFSLLGFEVVVLGPLGHGGHVLHDPPHHHGARGINKLGLKLLGGGELTDLREAALWSGLPS